MRQASLRSRKNVFISNETHNDHVYTILGRILCNLSRYHNISSPMTRKSNPACMMSARPVGYRWLAAASCAPLRARGRWCAPRPSSSLDAGVRAPRPRCAADASSLREQQQQRSQGHQDAGDNNYVCLFFIFTQLIMYVTV